MAALPCVSSKSRSLSRSFAGTSVGFDSSSAREISSICRWTMPTVHWSRARWMRTTFMSAKNTSRRSRPSRSVHTLRSSCAMSDASVDRSLFSDMASFSSCLRNESTTAVRRRTASRTFGACVGSGGRNCDEAAEEGDGGCLGSAASSSSESPNGIGDGSRLSDGASRSTPSLTFHQLDCASAPPRCACWRRKSVKKRKGPLIGCARPLDDASGGAVADDEEEEEAAGSGSGAPPRGGRGWNTRRAAALSAAPRDDVGIGGGVF